MTDNSIITVTPDVERITEGLRDTGYDLNSAIADLVDNSIAADATLIDVRIGIKDNGEPVVGIGDNGHGMDREALINCMRYGSRTNDDTQRLGKFGMGLKTASTAFCRMLVVVSRAEYNAEALQAVWDLDHLAHCGEWELVIGAPDQDAAEYLDLCAQKGPGTVVLWQKIDRLLTAETEPGMQSFEAKEQETVQARLQRITDNLALHLSLVFQRYLDPACEETRTVQLRLNGLFLAPWDPFLEQYSTPLGTHILTVTQGDEVVPIVLKAHLLPRGETLPDDATRDEAKLDTVRQGIYVYRENRLIHGPDWLGIEQQDPIWTLLRVSLSFDARIDHVFMVDIKKSRVLINEHLYAWLKNTFLSPLMEKARERWRQGAAESTKKTAETRHAISDGTISQNIGKIRKADVLEVFADKNELLVRNNAGTTITGVAVITGREPLHHIHTTAQTKDDHLWEPALINDAPGVSLNVGHPFYARVYMPNENNSTLVQGLDMLFWALAQAEVNNVTEESRNRIAALRSEMARSLAKLVEILPE